MSTKIVAAVLACQTGLDPRTKLVLLGMAEHCGPDGSHAYPSVKTLARYAECSERTVQRELDKLRKAGYLEVTGKASQHRPTEYAVILRGDMDVTPESRGDTAARGDKRESRGDKPAPRGDAQVSPEPTTEPISTEPPASRTIEDLKARASQSLAPPPPEPAAPQWTPVEEACVEKLWARHPAWKVLTWGGLKKLVILHGHETLTYALQRAVEGDVIPEAPYPYLAALCRGIEAESHADAS